MNNQAKKSKKILAFGITSIIPIVILLGIWMTLNSIVGWNTEAAGFFTFVILIAFGLWLTPFFLFFFLLAIYFWRKRDRSVKNKKDVIGMVLSSISLSYIGIVILFITASMLPLW